jgi:transposase
VARKAFKFRLSPIRQQEQTLFWTLARCRDLYNAALSEWKDAYKLHERTQLQVNPETGQVIAATMVANKKGRPASYYEQKRTLPEIKDLREEYQQIHSQVLQDVLLRLKRAFDGFFRRLENGEDPGYPRFQGRNRYNSFTYPQGGYSIDVREKRATVTLSNMGQFVQIVMHKAACAAREVYQINPSKTSQICSACGKQGPHKDLDERVHICIHCGVVAGSGHQCCHQHLCGLEEAHVLGSPV